MHEVREAVLLSKALLKNSMRPAAGKKGWKTVLMGIVLALCFIPVVLLLYGMFYSLFDVGFDAVALQVGFLMISLLNFFVVIFSIPSVFYFSSDTNILLPLPVKASSIVLAKLSVIWVTELTTTLLCGVPMCIAAITSGAFGFGQCLLYILELFLVSVIPLFVLGILTMLIMRFLPFFQNKDRFNLIVGVLSIVLCVGISLSASMAGYSQGAAENTLSDMEQLLEFIAYFQEGGLLDISTAVFFWVNPAAEAVMGSISSLLISLGICLLAAGIFCQAAEVLYLPAVTSAMASASKTTKKSLASKSSSFTKAAFFAELKKLVRSPAYLTNCVMSSFIMPVIFIVIIFVSVSGEDIQMLKSLEFQEGFLIPGSFLAGAALAFFAGGFNGICATAISREGISGVMFMKSIPVSLKKQLQAKLYVGMLFTIISTALFLVLFHLLLNWPWLADLLFLAGVILSSWAFNWLDLLCDGLRPKLVWDNETMAVKNNYNIVICMLLNWLILLLLCVPLLILAFTEEIHISAIMLTCGYAIFVLIVLGAAGLFLNWKAPVWIENHLSKLD